MFNLRIKFLIVTVSWEGFFSSSYLPFFLAGLWSMSIIIWVAFRHSLWPRAPFILAGGKKIDASFFLAGTAHPHSELEAKSDLLDCWRTVILFLARGTEVRFSRSSDGPLTRRAPKLKLWFSSSNSGKNSACAGLSVRLGIYLSVSVALENEFSCASAWLQV